MQYRREDLDSWLHEFPTGGSSDRFLKYYLEVDFDKGAVGQERNVYAKQGEIFRRIQVNTNGLRDCSLAILLFTRS
jgi:hypothetical protein